MSEGARCGRQTINMWTKPSSATARASCSSWPAPSAPPIIRTQKSFGLNPNSERVLRDRDSSGRQRLSTGKPRRSTRSTPTPARIRPLVAGTVAVKYLSIASTFQQRCTVTNSVTIAKYGALDPTRRRARASGDVSNACAETMTDGTGLGQELCDLYGGGSVQAVSEGGIEWRLVGRVEEPAVELRCQPDHVAVSWMPTRPPKIAGPVESNRRLLFGLGERLEQRGCQLRRCKEIDGLRRYPTWPARLHLGHEWVFTPLDQRALLAHFSKDLQEPRSKCLSSWGCHVASPD